MLTALSELVITLHKLGRLSEAEILNRRVLEAKERTLGLEHPST